MKTPSDRLFNLIKSLNRHEKRYFKMHSKGKNNKKNYIKLFDIIDKQPKYDEYKILKKLNKSEFSSTLKLVKRYLFNAILKSVSEYNISSGPDSELRNLLHQIEVLAKKKQNDIVQKLMGKAVKLAIEHEKYEYLLLLNAQKIGMIRKSDLYEQMKEFLNTDSIKEHNYIKCIKNNIDFRNLVLRAEMLNNSTSPELIKQNMNGLRSISRSTLLSSPKKALTFSASRYYYYLKFQLANSLNKWDTDAYNKQKEWVEIIEQYPSKLISRAENYLAALSRLLIAQVRSNNAEEIEKTFNKGKAFYQSLPSKMKNKNLLSFFLMNISNYTSSQYALLNPNKAIAAWESVKKSLPPNLLSIDSNMILNASLYHNHFMAGNYREALRYNNKNLTFKVINRPDILKDARIMSVLIHFELKNHELLASLTKFTLRWLSEHGSVAPVESLLLNFWGDKIHKISNNAIKIEAFKKLKQKIKLLTNKSDQSLSLKTSDIIAWLDSKIENRPLLEVLREKTST